VRVENVPDPKILNRRDAIVKISSTAICGSDLHLYNGFMPTMEKPSAWRRTAGTV
jgi:threonine dehydrogenase-like Zn-dependent dehydrogenase